MNLRNPYKLPTVLHSCVIIKSYYYYPMQLIKKMLIIIIKKCMYEITSNKSNDKCESITDVLNRQIRGY